MLCVNYQLSQLFSSFSLPLCYSIHLFIDNNKSIMTEADFEREAVKLFQQLGLTVGSESLNFFQGESVSLVDWKANFKTRLSKKSFSNDNTSLATAIGKMSASPVITTRQLRPPSLLSRRPSKTSDIGSEGSVSASPTSHGSREEEEEVMTPAPFKEENEEDPHYFGK